MAGIVEGRNVWRTDLQAALGKLATLLGPAGAVAVSTSCSTLHVPYSLEPETDLDDNLRSWLAFGAEKVREVVVLARPVEEEHAAVLAFLADGESWSSSALALALGASQRTVQRALDVLAAAGKVQPCGRGRARRWMTPPLAGFTTSLLLPAPLPSE